MASSESARSGADILERQETDQALTLLVAQRRLYSVAKRWNAIRVIGISAVALAAPVITLFVPGIPSEWVAAVVGLWIFLSGTVLKVRADENAKAAAAVQNDFDCAVFGLDSNRPRSSLPRPERLAKLVGPNARIAAIRMRLTGWYRLDARLPGEPAVAICQRANAVYTETLLLRHFSILRGFACGWAATTVVASIVTGISLTDFMLGIALPILPNLLDAQTEWRAAHDAAAQRGQLADTLHERILAWPRQPIARVDLAQWQDEQYRLRRESPLVPNILYKRLRSDNEAAMAAASAELARRVLSAGGAS